MWSKLQILPLININCFPRANKDNHMTHGFFSLDIYTITSIKCLCWWIRSNRIFMVYHHDLFDLYKHPNNSEKILKRCSKSGNNQKESAGRVRFLRPGCLCWELSLHESSYSIPLPGFIANVPSETSAWSHFIFINS